MVRAGRALCAGLEDMRAIQIHTLKDMRQTRRHTPAAAAAFLLLSISILAQEGSALNPWAPVTGHTGLPGSHAAVPTILGALKLEGAMIPRQCQVGAILQPRSTEDVSTAVTQHVAQYSDACKAAGHRLSIRATRAFYHASSDIGCPYTPAQGASSQCSLVLDMNGLVGIGPLDKENKVVLAGGGVLLTKLLQWLEARGATLDFTALPFYSNLTLAGMITTGAHGSSRTAPSGFWRLVRRTTWVDGTGGVRTTTNASLHAGVSGLLGIITEVELAVSPLTKLRALARRVHDRVLEATLPQVLADPNLALIQWLPDVQQAIVMTRSAVPASTWGNSEFQVLESHPALAPAGALALGINQADALAGDRHVLDDLPICLAELVLIPYHRHAITKIPVPFGIPAVGRTSIMATSDCIPGPQLGCFWRDIPINLLELDLPEARLAEWMGDVRRVVATEVATCLPSVIGFAMRFGRSSGAALDMAYGRDTVYADLVSNKGPLGVDDGSAYQHVFDELEQLSFCKYGARPHWGKNNNRAFTNERCPVAGKYPLLSNVLADAVASDPQGVFRTPIIDALLARGATSKRTGCALQGECYCDIDEHCGPTHACVPARTFPEYKVCRSRALSLKHEAAVHVASAVRSAVGAAGGG